MVIAVITIAPLISTLATHETRRTREILIHPRLHGPISVSGERHTDSNPALSSTSRPRFRRMRGPGATGAELVTSGTRLREHDEKDVGTTH